ncbi:alanine racemase [Brevibacillus fulvus]|uniref:Diaminopimelate decarboxylase n=1 Tax=Brevibacillus fulvus TaxID=1125967 RepID=A0A939BNU8_9BACL|nr:alanine racemase [Brevibacillus fulvus]MBM7589665.1 diaminopimelate decarboxylase [Brevibacillus fulvus]
MEKKGERLTYSFIRELAASYSTPLYIYDLETVQRQIDKIRSKMHPSIKLFYSMKANPNPTLVQRIYQTGVNIELCSLLELAAAQTAGVAAERMMYLGPGKSAEEIRTIMDQGVRYFVAESLQELELIEQIAQEKRKTVPIGVRINPEVAVRGARLQMGGKARQFGIDEGQFPDVLRKLQVLPHLRLCGIHTYHGTRILSANTIAENIRYILSFAERIIEMYGVKLNFVGIGGGFGIPYFAGEKELDLDELGQASYGTVEQFLQKQPETEILMESGRYLVAEAGAYVAQVRYTKRSQGVHFAVTDGGTHHHAAAGGSGNAFRKNFPIVAYVPEQRAEQEYELAGPLCTPNDLIGKKVRLPELHPGDYIAVLKSGAYGLTASPALFLSHRLPREVLLERGKVTLIRDVDEYIIPKLRKESNTD